MVKPSRYDQLDVVITNLLTQARTAMPSAEAELAPLVRIAGELRNLPRDEFVEKLKSDLERAISMATTTESIRQVRTFAAPRLTFKDAAQAIAFYQHAFEAKEGVRFEGEAGVGHAEIMIGDSVIMLCEEWPEGGRFSAETLGESPVSLHITVPDVDRFVEQAVAAGAKLTAAVRDEGYGQRNGTLVDPFGYVWAVSTPTEMLPAEEIDRRFRARTGSKPKKSSVAAVPEGYLTVTPYPIAQDAPALIEFIKRVFGAKEKVRSIGSAGGIHAELHIGDSTMMMGGGGPGLSWRGDSIPMAFHVYVPDCDATYGKALAAGASSISEPADQSYGERSGGVKDVAGNHWYIATGKGKSYKWEGAPDVQPYLHPLRAEPVIKFTQRAFGAKLLGRYASPDGVIHHVSIKIGDSYMEMGEAQGPYQPMPGMFYLHVDDCDAVYRRALAAGASSIAEPKDQPYGARSGGVKDAFGNQWYIASPIQDAGEAEHRTR